MRFYRIPFVIGVLFFSLLLHPDQNPRVHSLKSEREKAKAKTSLEFK